MELYKKMLVSGNEEGNEEGIYSFEFEINVSKGSGGTLNNFTLPITTASYVNPIYVDWGDGSLEEMIDNTSYPSHQYANGNIRVVKIRNTTGKMPHIEFGAISSATYNRSSSMLTKVLTPLPKLFDSVGVVSTSFSSCFGSCYFLTTIPNDLFRYNPQVENFSFCFGSCSNLTTIPNDLFRYNVSVTTFASCFSNCTGFNFTLISVNIFPSSFNVSSVDIREMFRIGSANTSMKGDAQDFVNFWSPKSTQFTYSLRNRTGMTNYSTIPSTWK